MTAPLPERLTLEPDGYLVDEDDVVRADTDPLCPEFTEELARRWNAHAGLVAALDDLIDIIAFLEDGDRYERRLSEARAALARARGER